MLHIIRNLKKKDRGRVKCYRKYLDWTRILVLKAKLNHCRPENADEIKVQNNDNVEIENFGMPEGCVGSMLSKAVDSAIFLPNNDPFYWENIDQTRDYLITKSI